MKDITEEEVKGYGFRNPSKLVEIINRFSKMIKEETGVSLKNGEIELSDECRLELKIMEYEDAVADIIKKHCI